MPTIFHKHLSRRGFLKESLLLAGCGLLTMNKQKRALWAFNAYPAEEANSALIRILADDVPLYQDTNRSSPILHTYQFNDVLEINQIVLGENNNPINRKWYEIAESGFVQATSAQPVQKITNEIKTAINIRGELAQVSVPFITAFPAKQNRQKNEQFFYYGSTHWVYDTVTDQDGQVYYKLKEDHWEDVYFVLAKHMHVFSDSELSPIHAEVPLEEKKIEVDLRGQILIAYEYGKPVLFSPMSSGALNAQPERATPPGEYVIQYKRPSRHMLHSERFWMNDVELFGVPWVSYFTDSGIAFHGTYWHNDFGIPHSHGCVNLPIPAARWIYLWSQPVVPPLEHTYVSKYGTQVLVY